MSGKFVEPKREIPGFVVQKGKSYEFNRKERARKLRARTNSTGNQNGSRKGAEYLADDCVPLAGALSRAHPYCLDCLTLFLAILQELFLGSLAVSTAHVTRAGKRSTVKVEDLCESSFRHHRLCHQTLGSSCLGGSY
jgi:hypothetical protein